ncbi:signal peptidase 22 kDa subunit [Eremomyces bilateralis CBS 781.70]|uniref:Signal peptidase subunit 3 n=1 Tax=Eremomyces bilateralis CBS 781.70 TaxID=1392243 RepID=A0A6G1G2A1_9PEZI|nr:signal peptidase 22 kDa subunit [Eremomyces bilateralis CBS 781.70]KAF1812184.1 signal peptidase 22 kDa subunit [Eremomyces bilateralis CBS 781.70]
MHSALVRLQNVFGFFTTVASCIAILIAFSSFTSPQTPSASLKLRNVQVVKGRPHYYSSKKEEYAHIKFDLDTDLSSLFNWNTKQVFLYIKATYPPTSPSEPRTEAILWDAILAGPIQPPHHNHWDPHASTKSRRSKSPPKSPSTKPPGIFKLANQRPKYQITDPSGRIAAQANATLELAWNVQPWVGALTWSRDADFGVWKKLKGGRTKAFTFPALKEKGEGLGTAKGGEGNRGKPA